MSIEWKQSAVDFMRQVIRGGGVRHIGTNSKFRDLASCLCHNDGMLKITHYYRRGRQGYAVYEVTQKGLKEFGS